MKKQKEQVPDETEKEGIRMLIVDDNPDTSQSLSERAEEEGFQVLVVKNGFDAVELFQHFQPDIVLLDVIMTGMDGFHICREIRKNSDVPIIFISVKEKTEERIMGLDMGADDYITEPFSSREVMARVRAVLRRIDRSPHRNENKILQVSNLRINIENWTVYVGEEKLNMTKKEVETMWLLADNPDRVFTREEILDYLWGEDYFGDGRSLDSHIKRMRSKFKDVEHGGWEIKTVWGLGYKFELRT